MRQHTYVLTHPQGRNLAFLWDLPSQSMQLTFQILRTPGELSMSFWHSDVILPFKPSQSEAPTAHKSLVWELLARRSSTEPNVQEDTWCIFHLHATKNNFIFYITEISQMFQSGSRAHMAETFNICTDLMLCSDFRFELLLPYVSVIFSLRQTRGHVYHLENAKCLPSITWMRK